MKSAIVILSLIIPLLLGGCALAGIEGVAAVDLAADGAVLDGAADAAMARGTIGGSGAASRVLVSDSLLDVAADRGVLQEALYRITKGGTETATLSLDSGGVIEAGSRPIAIFKDSEILYDNKVVGVLDDGWIYEVKDGVRIKPIARLHAFVPGNLAGLDAGRAFDSPLMTNRLFVNVLRVENGSYLVRLADQSPVSIRSEAAILALVAVNDGGPTCPQNNGTLIRHSGQALAFDSCTKDDGVFRLETANGLVIIDANEVADLVPGSLAVDAGQAAIKLTGGYSVYGQAERDGDVVSVRASNGDLLLADARRLAPTSDTD